MKHNFFVLVFTIFVALANAQEKIPLEQVVALALEKNYDIQLSKNSATSARIDNNYANGAFLPVITGTGSQIWSNSDQKQVAADNSTKEKNGIQTKNIIGAVQLTWTLFDGTKMFATRQRISEIAYQGELLVKNQIINSVANVVNNYYNIVRQKQQMRAIQEQMFVSEERVKLAEKKLQVGIGGKPELLQAKVDLNAQRTQVLQQQTIIEQLKDQLNGLVGMQLPTIYDTSDSIEINLNLQQEEIRSDIENTNFGLRAAQRSIVISNFSLHERRAEKFPTINFVSAYNFTRNETTTSLNAGTPLYSRNKLYNYGFTISIPIVNGFNNRRLIQQAELTVDRNQLLYDQQKIQVDVGLRNAFTNYDNARKVLVIEEETILLAKENVFIALESFKRGVSTFIELRTAQQSLADAYNSLITARYNAKVAETELLRLNGGLLK